VSHERQAELLNGNGNGVVQEEAIEEEEEPVEDSTEDVLDVEEEPDDEYTAPDPGAVRRYRFRHPTASGKTIAAAGFVEAARTLGVLILTHRRLLVSQFQRDLTDEGYGDRFSPPVEGGKEPLRGSNPLTIQTYAWFARHQATLSRQAYQLVICDEAHTALGEKTSAAIRRCEGPVFIGMTATGALIARHVADLFPTQTSRFDLAQAARRGVIAPLRCVRIPPGPQVRTLAKVPLRKGEVDQDFDLEELAALLDQGPFNAAVADLYRVRFKHLPGIVYSAGVKHAHNVAVAFKAAGIRAEAVSGETPKRELARILADFERGEIDVLINAMLLAEGWNSPRA
jgi:ribonuclease E